jgi:hypothetical protein
MKRLLFFCSMGLLDSDPINTGGVGGAAPSTPPASTGCGCDALCQDPGKGMPKFVKPVLENLLAEGLITRAIYTQVCGGALSIEALDIPPGQLVRLRCEGTGEDEVYDIHFDKVYPPALSGSALGLQVGFAAGHSPTDKVHRISVATAGNALAAGSIVVHVAFGSRYENAAGQPVAPNVMVSSTATTAAWRVASITPTGYDLVSDSGLPANTNHVAQVIVQAARL